MLLFFKLRTPNGVYYYVYEEKKDGSGLTYKTFKVKKEDEKKFLDAFNELDLEYRYDEEFNYHMNHALGGGITFCYDIKTDNKVMKVGGQTNNFLVISDPDQTYYIIDLWDPFFDVVRELNFKYDAYFFNEYLQTDADLWVRTHDRLEPDCNYYIFSVTGKRNVNSILEYMHMPLLEEDITVKDWYLSLSNGDLTLNNVVKDGDFEIKFTEPRDTLGFLIKIDKDIKKQMMNENN